ncbi:STAS domain-containing protein [Corticibacterium sp. UT-5YL-CI-8]|nr:STAS domain-containing protein [Tianweitania sp. UT-5YL-CI-8]
MDITSRQVADRTVVHLDGRLDVASAKIFEDFMLDLIGKAASDIVVDMSGVHYVASSGLRALIVTAKTTKASGRELLLSNLHANVREVFDISGFSAIFKIV